MMSHAKGQRAAPSPCYQLCDALGQELYRLTLRGLYGPCILSAIPMNIHEHYLVYGEKSELTLSFEQG